MHKELQIESLGVFIRLSVELLMEFMTPLVTLEKCWRRLEETENKQEREREGGTDEGSGRMWGEKNNLNESIILFVCVCVCAC